MDMGLEFLKEQTGSEFFVNEKGFVEYCFPNDQECYIPNIYVKPEFRREGAAKCLADKVAVIARGLGIKSLIGSVTLSARNVDRSIDVLRGYGMSLHSASPSMLIFKKEL